jgi:hypothetical protein
VTLLLYETLQHSIVEYFANENRMSSSTGSVTSTPKRLRSRRNFGWRRKLGYYRHGCCCTSSCSLLPGVSRKRRISFSFYRCGACALHLPFKNKEKLGCKQTLRVLTKGLFQNVQRQCSVRADQPHFCAVLFPARFPPMLVFLFYEFFRHVLLVHNSPPAVPASALAPKSGAARQSSAVHPTEEMEDSSLYSYRCVRCAVCCTVATLYYLYEYEYD